MGPEMCISAQNENGHLKNDQDIAAAVAQATSHMDSYAQAADNVEAKRQAHEDAKIATAAKEAAVEATWCQCKNDNLAAYNDALATGQKNDQVRTNSATFIGKIECMVEVKEDATYEAGDNDHRDQLVNECVAKFTDGDHDIGFGVKFASILVDPKTAPDGCNA